MCDLIRPHSAHHGTTRASTDERDQALTRLLSYYLTTARAPAPTSPRLSPTRPGPAGFPGRDKALEWLDSKYTDVTALTAEDDGHLAMARDLPAAMFPFTEWRRHFNDWISLAHTALRAARTLNWAPALASEPARDAAGAKATATTAPWPATAAPGNTARHYYRPGDAMMPLTRLAEIRATSGQCQPGSGMMPFR